MCCCCLGMNLTLCCLSLTPHLLLPLSRCGWVCKWRLLQSGLYQHRGGIPVLVCSGLWATAWQTQLQSSGWVNPQKRFTVAHCDSVQFAVIHWDILIHCNSGSFWMGYALYIPLHPSLFFLFLPISISPNLYLSLSLRLSPSLSPPLRSRACVVVCQSDWYSSGSSSSVGIHSAAE